MLFPTDDRKRSFGLEKNFMQINFIDSEREKKYL